MSQQIDLAMESDTVVLGERLAALLEPGAVVALVGPLGAGKTRLVQAIAAALGVTEEVTSPTFVLVNEYRSGRTPIYHFDAYRLKDEDEFIELGVDEYFAGLASSGPGLTFIEWGDRFANCLPRGVITITLALAGGESRRVTIDGLRLG